jgi:hypothetical protein
MPDICCTCASSIDLVAAGRAAIALLLHLKHPALLVQPGADYVSYQQACEKACSWPAILSDAAHTCTLTLRRFEQTTHGLICCVVPAHLWRPVAGCAHHARQRGLEAPTATSNRPAGGQTHTAASHAPRLQLPTDDATACCTTMSHTIDTLLHLVKKHSVHA